MARTAGPSITYRPAAPGYPHPPINNVLIRNMRSTDSLNINLNRPPEEVDEYRPEPIDPNRRLTPAWLIFTPRKKPEVTAYDDPLLIPHMTLNRQRAIRYPDQWPGGLGPYPNNRPEGEKGWTLALGVPSSSLSAESIAEAHPLAGITSRESLLALHCVCPSYVC